MTRFGIRDLLWLFALASMLILCYSAPRKRSLEEQLTELLIKNANKHDCKAVRAAAVNSGEGWEVTILFNGEHEEALYFNVDDLKGQDNNRGAVFRIKQPTQRNRHLIELDNKEVRNPEPAPPKNE